ncbi:NEQ363 [Nanoarchaeum equitans Kin4-M]|uniref:DNA/RNA-binding protein Alba n=1 Tax=Nanoarchaeum equitans (strain Kin4-M) TaxID=228908 RepID=ALBA_NANEQ|nr:RecName: Full=DNA/RNA-binding protein Alba [Nanoarchaeum equitans Kin4-M]AAR39212.1 NEQ363 [Nanoarchaeum equitans Kin4-M]
MPEVFIGKKPLTNYVMAVVMQFMQGANEVVIKARGRNISRAVDVAERVRKRFLAGQVDVGDIKIDSEEVVDPATGQKRTVSTIEIKLVKK